jgi:hypothetical protein
MMNTLRPITTTTASISCAKVTTWLVNQRPSGSTKTIDIVKIG